MTIHDTQNQVWVKERFLEEMVFFKEQLRLVSKTRGADSAGRRTGDTDSSGYVDGIVEGVSYAMVRRDTMGILEIGDIRVKFAYDVTVEQEDILVRSNGENYELKSYSTKNLQETDFIKEFIGKRRPPKHDFNIS